MRVEGERSFAAPRATVWEVLNDPSRMAKTMPGVQSFDIADDRHWAAHVKIPLGLGGLQMKINFEKTEEREPDYAKLHAKGTGVGALMSMDTQFHLSDAGGGTQMRWEAEVHIAGPVGSMGQRVLQPIVNQQVAQVLAALDRQVTEAAGAAPAPAPAAAEQGGQAMEEPEPTMGATPTSTGEDVLQAGAAEAGAGDTGDSVASATGPAGTPSPSPDIPPPETDATLRDAGEPATSSATTEPEEGTSGAEEGLNPWDSASYEPEPEGPRTSTEG